MLNSIQQNLSISNTKLGPLNICGRSRQNSSPYLESLYLISRTFKMMSIMNFLSSKFPFLNVTKWENIQRNTTTLCHFKYLRLPQLFVCLNIMIFGRLLKKICAISLVPIKSSFLSRTFSISNKYFGPFKVRDREILLFRKVRLSDLKVFLRTIKGICRPHIKNYLNNKDADAYTILAKSAVVRFQFNRSLRKLFNTKYLRLLQIGHHTHNDIHSIEQHNVHQRGPRKHQAKRSTKPRKWRYTVERWSK